MKKLFFLICTITFAAAAFSQATKPPKGNPVEVNAPQKVDTVKKNAAAPNSDSTQQKLLVLQGSLEGFNALIIALEKSNESHVIIESLKQWIVPQINQQLPPADKPKN